jgi:high-affinity Fe2+/Pb2+ permease
VLSLIPIVAGLLAFVRHGRIDPASGLGKVYWAGMIASVVTAFGLSSTGGFNPGHALGLLTLLVMACVFALFVLGTGVQMLRLRRR